MSLRKPTLCLIAIVWLVSFVAWVADSTLRDAAGSDGQPGGAPAAVRSPGIDELLGTGGRQRHAARLAKTPIESTTYGWEQYARWGRELYHAGQVAKPPIGVAPSMPISNFYRCTHCHNNRREDPNLVDQDPEARAEWIAKQPKSTAPDARPLFLAPGTTLWGAVNRESFYNDAYELYHSLTVDGGREMNPESLEDAIQVCCSYCSVGRLAEPWEMLSFLTYFWDLEVRLADLDLPAPVERAVLDVLSNPAQSPRELVLQTRRLMKRMYLRRAGDSATAPPSFDADRKQGPYSDKLLFEGDVKLGARWYALACEHCHGEGKPNELSGADLVRDRKRFHAVLSHGTSRDDEPYMPMFTAQRLSRQQIADIQVYLESLAK
jgi:hypothetical protein